jgi:NAD(P)H-hydrate epimerase
MALTDFAAFALTAAAMREADRRTIEDLGIPGHTLMESAARGAVAAIEAHSGGVAGLRVAILCGRGNNGGDGLAMARVLHARGAEVDVFLFAPADALAGDAALNHRVLEAVARAEPDRLRVHGHEELPEARAFDLAVDALLGTGQASPPRPPIDAGVAWLNARRALVVSVDLPTGLHADTGAVLGEAVRAGLTVTMGAPKTGLLLGAGRSHAGTVVPVEIGIPAHVIREVAQGEGCARITTDAWVGSLLRGVERGGTKFSSGPTLVAGGSLRYAGAPVMAATAAARAGSGYVVCAAPEAARETIASHLVEIPFVGLPSDPEGFADGEPAASALDEAWPRVRAVLVGPGIGRTDGARRFVRAVLASRDGTVVVDADGLNAIDADFVAAHSGGRWILTPHEAEFERLGGAVDDRSPVVRAAEAARAWGTVVVLKGLPSVVAAPDGRVAIAGTGNPSLATAGTGDVLAGLCAGLAARGLEPFEAAVAGLHLGGAAADRFAARSGRSSMMATDLIRQIGPVLHERFR